MKPTVVEIPVSPTLVAVVDVEDEALVSMMSWHPLRRDHAIYAAHTARDRRTLLIHRVILGLSDSRIYVDHRDGDGLNNRRSNLRVCTSRLNIGNSRRRVDNVTGFKGVGFNPRTRRYHAHIRVDDKNHYLGGRFATAEEAHAAYCEAAQRVFGEFARFK